MVHLEELQQKAREILEAKTVKYLVGYKRGTNGLIPVPAFFSDPEDTEKLIWEPTCVYNLSRYLVDEKRKKEDQKSPDNRPLAIIAKGCDTRAISVLLQEKLIDRQDIFIIGISCEETGVVDGGKINKRFKDKKPQWVKFNEEKHFVIGTRHGKIKVPASEIMAERCLECATPYPIIYDILVGEKRERDLDAPYASISEMEAKDTNHRWEFWQSQLDECLRCYACRSICPLCYCRECTVDPDNLAVTPDTKAEEKARRVKWIEKSPSLQENMVFHLVRALHLTGRCIDCGECERACPANIPLRLINRKMEKEAALLFGYKSGMDPDQAPLFSDFSDRDPQEFIL